MASSTNRIYYYYYPLHGLKVSIFTVAFIFGLTLLLDLPSKCGKKHLLGYVCQEVFWRKMKDRKRKYICELVLLSEESKMMGSKPPACVNKCSNCRPCMATLVVPNHQRKDFKKVSSHGEDDSYYLLSWKCRCGNKLFQP